MKTVSNKSPVLSFVHFIKHYMLFLSSFPAVTPKHDLETPFVGISLFILYYRVFFVVVPLPYITVSCCHRIVLTLDKGWEDWGKIKVPYQLIVYISELIKLLFFLILFRKHCWETWNWNMFLERRRRKEILRSWSLNQTLPFTNCVLRHVTLPFWASSSTWSYEGDTALSLSSQICLK
jgi:hypothetical protein